jgi:hypothetical protein
VTLTYTPISDGTIAQDEPVTTTLVQLLRDNPIAMVQAASGAPLMDPGAIANRPLLAYPSSKVAISSNTATLVFNTKTFDVGGFYNTSTGKFQPTEAGLYLMAAHIQCNLFKGSAGLTDTSGASDNCTYDFRKNGSTNFAEDFVAGATTGFCIGKLTGLVSLNGSTDYVELVRTGSGGSVQNGLYAGPAASFLFAIKVGVAP